MIRIDTLHTWIIFGLCLSFYPLRAELLPPVATEDSEPGAEVASPWRSSNDSQGELVHVVLRSPDGHSADWIEIKDDSPSLTANLRFTGMPAMHGGLLKFTVELSPTHQGDIIIALGTSSVTQEKERSVMLRIRPNGSISLGSHDSLKNSSYRLRPGVAAQLGVRFKIEEHESLLQFIDYDIGDDSILDVTVNEWVEPITAIRITTFQQGMGAHAFFKDLSLEFVSDTN